jgi:hypothetical protein
MRPAWASSAVTMPRPSRALAFRNVTILDSPRLAAVSLQEAGERVDHHQDELEQRVVDRSAGHDS